MILQSLVAYYEALVKKGELAQPGWSPVKVSYALELNDEGEITNVIYLKEPDQSGKKMVPKEKIVPMQPFRSGISPDPYFLCDFSSFLLGISYENDNYVYKNDYFVNSRELHRSILGESDNPAAQALLRFFEHWSVEKVFSLADEDEIKDILAKQNLVFYYKGEFVHEIAECRKLWLNHYYKSEAQQQVCLVTGSITPIEEKHPHFSAISNKSAALVSFNEPAFWSYGRKRNYNAPIGKYAAFAYGAALNYLISKQHTRVGDTTVLFWAKTAEEQYQTIWDYCCFGDVPEYYKEEALKGAVKSICAGRSVIFDNTRIDPDMSFYLLGLAPNSARLSVRFFLRNSFGTFLRNIQAHYDRLEIVHSYLDRFDTIPIWKLLSETVNQNARDKTPAPGMAGETLRAILNNTPYPATLLNGVNLRIRADRQINRTRAAIIKAYYLKKPHPDIPKEVLQVSLNPDCREPAYVLGRVFSVLERIQYEANKKEKEEEKEKSNINSTIHDKYFSSASTIPLVVFPTLIDLSQKHLRKLRIKDERKYAYLDKQLRSLLAMIEIDDQNQPFPAHLSLPQQGAFQLGYYHENEARFTKKEDKENV